MIWKTLTVYWSAMRPQKWLWFIAFTAHIIFFIGVDVVAPILVSRFIGDLTHIEGKTISNFYPFLWLWLALHFGQTFFGRIGIHTWFRALAYTLMDLDLKSFTTTLSHSSDFFSNNFTGSLVTKFNRFTRSFEIISTAAMFDLNSLFVQIIFPFGILLFISPPIALFFLVWSILFAWSLVYLHKKKLPRTRKVAEFDSKATGVVADVITNALSVKMFSRFPDEYASFRRLGAERVKARYRNMLFGDVIRVYKVLFIIMLEVPVFYLSAKFAIEGRMNVSQILLIQLYVQRLITSLWNFGKLIEKLEEAMADATEMAEIYNLQPSVLDPVKPMKFLPKGGDIKFENISFSYDGDNEQEVFSDLNLTVPSGQKIGFVGPSGGGKTTLTKLLLRFMDVTAGKILIDGQDIATVRQDELRHAISYIPQEPLLFHRSIYDNIAYGDPKASRDEVMEAAKLAHADEFIDKLPQGYGTLVGERGVKLSGGQKQRVAIARAMLKKAPILVMDEATSALDSKSEKHITEALDRLMENRTTLVIAHRLSTIRKLDRIVVLKDGAAPEDGSHAQLLAKKGVYAELWNHQHDGFLDE
jgi:ATP-binding cassette, subfamily B, bacterial